MNDLRLSFEQPVVDRNRAHRQPDMTDALVSNPTPPTRGAIRTRRITPLLRVNEFEDEEENEALCESP